MKKLSVCILGIILSSLFLLSVTAQTSPYDPWADLDDDGDIDIYDIVDIAGRYGTTGTAINKTTLLLELMNMIESLNTSLLELEARVAYLESRLPFIDPVGHWKFDEGTGTVAYDSSINRNNATIYGATWTSGYLGSALGFNGADNYVEVNEQRDLEISHISVEAWVKVNGSTGDHQVIISKWIPHNMYVLEFRPDGITPQIALVTTSSGKLYTISDTTVPFGSWVHLAVTYDGTLAKIFVNGTVTGITPQSGSIIDTESSLFFGSHSPDVPSDRNWFNGIIDNVIMYNRTLDETEVMDHYLGHYP